MRFDKLTYIINSKDEFDCNDLGCGYGELFNYLNAKFSQQLQMYNGYDLSQSMLDAAENNLNARKSKLIKKSSIHTIADYTFASGPFNVKFDISDEKWKTYIEDSLHNMFKHSRKGFAFNLLTSYVDWKEDHLFYCNPNYFFDYCKSNFSSEVLLFHDYPLYEWTIGVRLG